MSRKNMEQRVLQWKHTITVDVPTQSISREDLYRAARSRCGVHHSPACGGGCVGRDLGGGGRDVLCPLP